MDAFISLLRDRPLYDSVELDGREIYSALQAVEHGLICFDTHCPECGALTTWQGKPATDKPVTDRNTKGAVSYGETANLAFLLLYIRLTCARDATHHAKFSVVVSDMEFQHGYLQRARL